MSGLLQRFTGGGSWRERAFLVLFLILCAMLVVSLNRHVDPDLFWHLRGGMDIVKAGKVVLPDSWTYLFEGQPWVNHQWGSEVLFYAFYQAGGYAGLLLLKGLLVCAMLLFVLGALRSHAPVVRYMSAAMFLLATGHYLIFRTHLLSLVCLAALLFLLERLSARARLGWLVAPLRALGEPARSFQFGPRGAGQLRARCGGSRGVFGSTQRRCGDGPLFRWRLRRPSLTLSGGPCGGPCSTSRAIR